MLRLENTFRQYVALDDGLPLVLALWTLATHVFACFDAFGYLAITSPTKRCGKTRLAEIIEILSAKGLRTVGASPAAIFRSIEADMPTLIIDEAETLSTRNDRPEAMREILNAGYRDGQFVLRCESSDGHSFKPKRYKTYCPKALVLIGELPDTLADRCIPIRMRRIGERTSVERFRYSRAKWSARPFLKDIAKWADANKSRIKRYCRVRNLKFLKDREEELWLPLFAVCTATAPGRLKELEGIATRIAAVKASAERDEIGVTLLTDIHEVFSHTAEKRLPSSTLVYELMRISDSPWQEWSRGRGLEPRGLARLLRPFRIEPRNLRLADGKISKGYERIDFDQAWGTYLPTVPAATPLQHARTQATNELSDPLRSATVADAKTPETLQ